MSDTEIIRVELGGEVCELEQLAGVEARVQAAIVGGAPAPLWGVVWPSARALAALVGSAPDLSGQRVIELGCGVGLVGLAAARRGAEVVVSDLVPEAVALAERNAERNGERVLGRVFDWNAPPADLGRFDAVLAADVLYADGMLAGVLRFVRGHLKEGGAAYLADPNRVMDGGVAGAARLRGLEAASLTLGAGPSLLGGVTLYHLTPRGRRRASG